MNIEQVLNKLSDSKQQQEQLQKQVKEQLNDKKQIILRQKQKIQSDLQQKISSIIVIKKRKLDYNIFIQMTQKLKLYSTSCKNLIQTFFKLLIDQQQLIIYSYQQINHLIQKFRFSLLRSIHNMNRVLIKQSDNYKIKNQNQKYINNQSILHQNKSTFKKKKKKKKGKNSKMFIQQTGFMYKWILQNFDNPYPSQQHKQKLSKQSKISISKVNYWFINMRERTLKKLLCPQKQIPKKPQKSQDIQQSQDLQAELNSQFLLKQQQ